MFYLFCQFLQWREMDKSEVCCHVNKQISGVKNKGTYLHHLHKIAFAFSFIQVFTHYRTTGWGDEDDDDEFKYVSTREERPLYRETTSSTGPK